MTDVESALLESRLPQVISRLLFQWKEVCIVDLSSTSLTEYNSVGFVDALLNAAAVVGGRSLDLCNAFTAGDTLAELVNIVVQRAVDETFLESCISGMSRPVFPVTSYRGMRCFSGSVVCFHDSPLLTVLCTLHVHDSTIYYLCCHSRCFPHCIASLCGVLFHCWLCVLPHVTPGQVGGVPSPHRPVCGGAG